MDLIKFTTASPLPVPFLFGVGGVAWYVLYR